MPLNPNVPLQSYLYCTTCKQYCPSRHSRISEWWDWHAKNCKPRKTEQNKNSAEPYAPWAVQHVKQSDEILEGYLCAISPTEMLALMGQDPSPRPAQMSGPSQYGPTKQGPY